MALRPAGVSSEAVAPQVGGVDLAAQEARRLEPLHVHRHRRLGHAQRRGELGGVGVLVDLGEHEQLLGLEPQRGDVGPTLVITDISRR